MAHYCPNHADCPFYQNWIEQTKNKRVTIIVETSVENVFPVYDCLAIMSIKDPETGIGVSSELESRLERDKNPCCSHLTLLNKPKTENKNDR